MARIFISYAREDAALAQSFFLQLKNEFGHEPWMDQPPKPFRHLGIEAGEDWDYRLETEINAADAALFLISRNSVSKAGVVQKEQKKLLDKVYSRPTDSIFLVPVVVDDTKHDEIPNTRVGTVHLKDLNILWLENGRLDAIVSTLNRIQSQLNNQTHSGDISIPLPTSTLIAAGPVIAEVARPAWHHRGTISAVWSQFIGKQRRSYRPIPVGDKIVVASCGREFGKVDDRTGIYALDPIDGVPVWYAPTLGDPGGFSLINGRIVGGTRNGQIVCLDPASGQTIWQRQGNHPIDVSPQLWMAGTGDPVLVVIERGGSFILLDPINGSDLGVYGLNRRLWHTPIARDDGTLVVFSQEGELLRFEMRDGTVRVANSLKFSYAKEYADGNNECRFEADPLVVDDTAYVPFARETYYGSIPLLAIDLASDKLKWREPKLNSDTQWSYPPPAKGDRGGFGNLRHRPVAVDDGLLAIPAYSEEAFIVSPSSGEVTKAITLVGSFRSQLATPAVLREGRVLAPRADGYVYNIDVPRTCWSYRVDCSRPINLGEMQHYVLAGGTLPKFEKPWDDSLRRQSAFVGEMLLQPNGFLIATQDGTLHRMQFN